MPHHSGGGSHHGGSHHSSHSSHHSYSGAGRSSSAPLSPRISRRPYSGARKYTYTHPRTHRQYVYYYKGEPPKARKLPMITILIFISLFFLPYIVGSAVLMVSNPIKTDLNSYEHSIVITDTTGLIKSDAGLYDAMEEFQTITGVTPSVFVVYDNAWDNQYYDLADFAYDIYVSQFNDEKHWLLTVSVPHSNTIAGNVDWKFEGIIGDDVGKTISRRMERKFTDLVQANLSARSLDELTEGIRDAYTAMNGIVMKRGLVPAFLILYLVFGAIYVGLCSIPVYFYKRAKRLEEAAKDYVDETIFKTTQGEIITPGAQSLADPANVPTPGTNNETNTFTKEQ